MSSYLPGGLVNALWLCTVALLWGFTNPFIKQGGAGIERISTGNRVTQFLAELKFLFTNWKYLLPFSINQLGSVLFYITLSSTELSLAVPITNSLTFVFTAIAGTLLGEKIESKETYIGMALVTLGVGLCVMGKT